MEIRHFTTRNGTGMDFSAVGLGTATTTPLLPKRPRVVAVAVWGETGTEV